MKAKKAVAAAAATGILAAGLAVVGASGAWAIKQETCHDANFLELFGITETCWAGAGSYSSVPLYDVSEESGGNNNGYTYESGVASYYYFFANSGQLGVYAGSPVTTIDIY
jgi:hypothetical protein